jgi:glutathione S-transferase
MGNAMKLYNHALAPNPRRVRIFAAEKGIDLALQDVDILAGHLCNRTHDSKYEFDLSGPFQAIPGLR